MAKQFALQIWTVDLFNSLLFLHSETHILYKYLISALADGPSNEAMMWIWFIQSNEKDQNINYPEEYVSVITFNHLSSQNKMNS